MRRFNFVQLSGLVALATGLLLLALACYGAADPMGELSTSLTGRDTGHALWLVGLGAAAALAGVLLMLVPVRPASSPASPSRMIPP
jgi:hypothetical protein